jgi:tetratricopeptide (TPR) repeat protein
MKRNSTALYNHNMKHALPTSKRCKINHDSHNQQQQQLAKHHSMNERRQHDVHTPTTKKQQTVSREVREYCIRAEVTTAAVLSPKELIQKGIEHAQQRRLFEAVITFDQAIAGIINNNTMANNSTTINEKLISFAFFNRGLVRLQMSQFGEAIVDFTEAIGYGCSDSVVFFTRGTCFMNLKRYQEAVADFSQVLSLVPNDCEALMNRAMIYTEVRMYEEAITDCCTLISIRPTDASVFSHRSAIFTQMKRYDEALVDAHRAMMLEYGNVVYQQKYNSLQQLVETMDNGSWEDNVTDWGSDVLYL